jgi:FlaA1/EpsC-like NDP-sugar epimerase
MIRNIIKGKTILVTGGTGTIGGEVVRQVLQYDPKAVRILSRDEHKQFLMAQRYSGESRLRFLIGDIRDMQRVHKAMNNVDIVFHAAALKHVPSCEYNPFEAVATNVMGTQNLVEAAMENNVEHFIGISTDKAASPNSVMGATKLLAEKIVTSASNYEGGRRTIFASVRFGNVLGSRGSLVRLVQDQIVNGSPVTVTDPDMCRFFISISDAVNLVFKALLIMQGGELFILKMPVVRIGDMIEVLKEVFAEKNHKSSGEIETDIIGRRPGEKKHESLMTEDESNLAYENDEMYIIMNSGLYSKPGDKFIIPKGFLKSEIHEYNTKKVPKLSKKSIKNMVMPVIKADKY